MKFSKRELKFLLQGLRALIFESALFNLSDAEFAIFIRTYKKISAAEFKTAKKNK